MNRAELESKVKALELELSQAKEQLASMPKKWEPKGGDYYINGYGDVVLYVGGQHSGFGTEYATQEQAEKAAKAMRVHNRLLAYVAEFAPDYEFQGVASDWCICYDCNKGCWIAGFTSDKVLSGVYMPEDVANTLADKLNSGEVEL